MSNSERTIYLIDRYIDDTATISEREELSLLLEDPSCDEAAKIYLLQVLRATQPLPEHSPARWEEIRRALGHDQQPAIARRKVTGYRFWWSIAALVTGVLVIFYFYQQRPGLSPAHPGQTLANDRAPGGNVATLTLSDGSTIALDSVRNGTLAQQGNTSIAKLGNGQLAYNMLHEKPGTVLFNTLTTPRGGQYRLVLPDGSGVWLNAASSITYPTAFVGAERRVSIRGEAYFEVMKNAVMPFSVSIAAPAGGDSLRVEVLGTHFNVNAYTDEDAVRTTLLEGSVRLVRQGRGAMLTPGQQGQLQRDGSLSVIPDVDTDETVAWKEGRFNFENADIATVMRQIARWYDVDVVFEGKIAAERFTGEIPRSSKLTEVFTILELSNVHCRIDKRKVTVMP